MHRLYRNQQGKGLVQNNTVFSGTKRSAGTRLGSSWSLCPHLWTWILEGARPSPVCYTEGSQQQEGLGKPSYRRSGEENLST